MKRTELETAPTRHLKKKIEFLISWWRLSPFIYVLGPEHRGLLYVRWLLFFKDV